ncbi:amino acid adenylation domain-containing protein [Micromonospora pisi]|uniref:Amino acid adenylation domain-containing protein n=1 Tax=Micromonospora pisi TaxID=589240 RepID=A0A495JE41_9ACTN|nr:non-ribosomal peptide synthetase [Micromonospora pisi]RKR87001.1 amino acid adenylation domain-containing protein [Micromonospora pisi]
MTGDTFVLPASSTQRRLWMLDQLDPGSAAYNIAWSVRLTGELRVDALRATLDWLVGRHEVLRTVFTSVDGEPAQVVGPKWSVPLPVTDPGADGSAGLDALLDAESRAPFDLATGPLLRVRLVRLAPDQHVLILVVHHIVADGWSFDTVFDELAHGYRAAVAATVPELPPPPIQYADFAVWQREQAHGSAFAEDLAYWRAELAGAPTLLDLPADRPRPAEQSPAGGLVTFPLPAELTDGVRRLARDADTTDFAVLLSGFQALLHRLSGQPDLLVAVPVSGRSRPETRGVVGFFANTLALRGRFEERTSFAELLGAARSSAIAAQSRQDVPFEELVDLLAPQRSLAYSPLVQVMFALEQTPAPVEAAGLRIAPELHENGTVKFDLTLTVEERPDGWRGRLTYRTELFDADRIERLGAAYLALLGAAVEQPSTPVAELPLLSPAARAEIIAGWRAERLDPPPYDSIAALFARHPPADPDAVAVAAPDATLTYQRLTADRNRLAHLLREYGIDVDVPVGICLTRGSGMLTAMLAVWQAGGGYLPLDPELPTARLAGMARSAGVPLILTDRASADRTGDCWPTGTRVLRLDDAEQVTRLRALPETPPTYAAHPDSLAYLLYTSGSTGVPKGVAVTHGSVANLLVAFDRLLCLTAADRVAALTTNAFDISVVELVLPLLAGARVELFDSRFAQDSAALRSALAERGVTTMQATPASWRMLLAAGGVPANVRLRISGGEALTRDLADALCTDGATLVNGYGPSETSIYSTAGRVDADGPVNLGGPVANTRLYLLDPAGQPVPVGAVGELHLGGLGVARGYHGDPARTAVSFRPDPWSSRPGARLYATGDLARWLPGGRLEYLGRADQQVKLRGYRIELGEIETALRAQEGIRDAVVVTWRASAEDVRLVGYVVPTDPHADPAALWSRLRPALAAQLPEYMLPATLVPLDRFPRTGSGKVDRRGLPEPVWRDADDGNRVAPRTPVEKQLALLWGEVLGLAGVGVHDNFFNLGGHSLTATRLIARIRTTFGVDLPLRLLFAAPTIAELAPRVADPATAGPHRNGTTDRVATGGPSAQDLLASLDDLSDREIDELLDTLIAEEGS